MKANHILKLLTGSMGITVGPALQRALEGKFPGQVNSMGVKYPASIEGAVTGAINPAAAEGSKDMTAKAKRVMADCPQSKIILSGYGQFQNLRALKLRG
jgi:cutinase